MRKKKEKTEEESPGAPSVAEQKPETPEKVAGPQKPPAETSSASASKATPPLARTADRLTAPGQNLDTAERGRMMGSMQQGAGNARVGRMLGTSGQQKTEVSSPEDSAEKEADQIADKVMLMGDTGTAASDTTAGGTPGPSGEGGQPLSQSDRNFMEPRFSRSFEKVRLHTDRDAQQEATGLGAKAFTRGSDISFGPGSGPDDKKLLAHELTHVIQQDSSGPTTSRRIHRQGGGKRSALAQLDEMLAQYDVPEEQVIYVLGLLNAAEKKTVLSGSYKDLIAGALNIKEMVRAVRRLGPPLAVKLEWVNAAADSTSDIDYRDISGFVRTASAAERSVLKSGLWRDFFVDVCGDTTIITALNDLGFDLATKLEWADEEIGLSSYSTIKGFVTNALQIERDALKTGLWRSFFIRICGDNTMAEAVNDLGFDLATKLDWMVAEETNIKLVASAIRRAPAAELSAVAANAALMKRLRAELGQTDFQTAEEMLTQGLLSQGPIEQSTDTGNLYKSWLRHTRGEVTISKDVKFIEGGTFSAGGFNTLKQRLITAVTSYLSGRYKVKIETPGKPPQVGDGDYPILVVVKDNPKAAYPMHLHGGAHGRSQVTEDEGNIYELGLPTEASVPDIVLAHESAHMILGASDEYANASVPARTLHTDHSLMGNFYIEGIAAAEIKARHFGFLVKYIGKYFPDRKITVIK